MQRKTVRIYSFCNCRSKDSYAQNFDTALYNLLLKIASRTLFYCIDILECTE